MALKTETITTCSDGRKFKNDPEGAAKHEEALQNVGLIKKFVETELQKAPGMKSHMTYTNVLVKWEAFRLAVEEADEEDEGVVEITSAGGTA